MEMVANQRMMALFCPEQEIRTWKVWKVMVWWCNCRHCEVVGTIFSEGVALQLTLRTSGQSPGDKLCRDVRNAAWNGLWKEEIVPQGVMRCANFGRGLRFDWR